VKDKKVSSRYGQGEKKGESTVFRSRKNRLGGEGKLGWDFEISIVQRIGL
jgi:hypothetical protein